MPAATSLPLLLITITAVAATTAAKEFQVGDAVGWRIPAANETELYNVWASRRRFHIGDSLRFCYDNDSVVMVDKWGFYHCDPSHPIAFFNDGDTLVNFDKEGAFYFISGSPNRCDKGQRMIVNVNKLRRFSPSTADPPVKPYYSMSPSPSQGSGTGTGTGSASSSGSRISVSAAVVARIFSLAGLGLWLIKP